jgi:hypothetical protein
MMIALFPPSLVDPVLQKLEVAAKEEFRPVWSQARETIADLVPKLEGDWICTKFCPAGGEGAIAKIIQDGATFKFVNEGGGISHGYLEDKTTVIATDWQRLAGFIKDDGKRIEWINGTVWVRK